MTDDVTSAGVDGEIGTPVRMGLVGYGFGARFFHAPLMRSAPEVELVGVVTRSPERRTTVEQDAPGTATFDDLSALAAAGVEAVAISTPAATHTDLAHQALDLGLAVVCDKPFALDEASARSVVEHAEAAGLILSAYQNRRWDSDFRTLQALLSRGTLGDIVRYESAFERWQAGPPEAGGGTLLDFGSHLVDQALVLFGPVVSVYAELDSTSGALDRDAFVALTHASGVHSHLRGSWIQGEPAPRLRVTGTEGTYVVTGMDQQEAHLLAGDTPAGLGDEWGAEKDDRGSAVHRDGGTMPVPLQRGRWDTYYPSFARAVRGRGPAPVDARDAVRTAQVLDAARRSARDGTTVAVS